MTKQQEAPARSDRLLETLERLLALEATDLTDSLNQAAQSIAEALEADKVDAFLHAGDVDVLVAFGTSDTPMGRRQKALGLDRLPTANGGRAVHVFRDGRPFLTGHAEDDPEELIGIREGLAVRSSVMVPLEIGGERRGVLLASSAQSEFFTERDLAFLTAVAHWVGLLAHRAELVGRLTQAAAEAGRRTAADELITVVAHDLGNYLTTLRGRIELIRRRALADQRPADVREADQALHALARLDRLTGDLLDVGRLERGLFAIDPSPVDLVRLTEDVAAALSTETKPIRVTARGPIIGYIDPGRISQALENLLSNAVRHTPEGAAVAVELTTEPRPDARRAIITIRDQGPGIPPDLL
ncbi:MAG TPA: HAMP domain-containing sensor histidine kinase, partial [Dehalococcoidia bacterium]|nr:HAMP domain-containing sensor histidine kinase [Dehalococcoidia bacterium]